MSSARFFQLREQLIPGPSQTTGYRTVLFLGTTGAGKTTLIRQLLGAASPEGFPATSASKTTVAEAELLLAPGEHYAVATFMTLPEVCTYIEENVVAAGLAVFDDRPEAEVRKRLLEHADQRFRLNYILTDGLAADGGPAHGVAAGSLQHQLQEATEGVLAQITELLREVVFNELEDLTASGQVSADDVDLDELHSLLKSRLVGHPVAQEIMYYLLEEIEARFGLIDPAEVVRGEDGWPVYWRTQSPDRAEFMGKLRRLCGNDAADFGTLLTPIVNGVRVRGPFHPRWVDEIPYLMLVDREGLGHTLESASSLPSHTTRMLDEVDTIVLVDNAQQPMQAAPVAALRQIAAAGHGSKLILAFTHFELVQGPNLPDLNARRQHVISSVDQVLTAIGNELGYSAERLLRYRLDRNLYFLSRINDELDEDKAPRTIAELRWMLGQLRVEGHPLHLGECRPQYSRNELQASVRDSIVGFLRQWEQKLGLAADTEVTPVHWSKVKALCVRYARRSEDEYEALRPAGDLVQRICDNLRRFVTQPLGWSGEPPDEDTEQMLHDRITQGVARRVQPLVTMRLFDEAPHLWAEARDLDGPRSAQHRAEFIYHKILSEQVAAEGGNPVGEHADFAAAVVHELAAELESLDIELTG
ncbi:MAG: hypothetical protein ACKVWR_22360 [Acidimicrobiales bacterium]